MKKILLFIAVLTTYMEGNTQAYTDYIGAGHTNGVTVSSSDQVEGSEAINSLNGSGMDYDKMNASRFLAQSTLGYKMDEINALAGNSFEEWIDNQIDLVPSNFPETLENIWQEVLELHVAAGENPEDVFGPYQLHFNYTWWTINMTNEDKLRQRMALALSELLVISMNSDLSGHVDGVASYYDVLVRNSFGNFEDLLLEVSLHPSMGYYLSHMNNPKEDLDNNIHPDENYAREIMQLFSIGLYELNIDGSRKKDTNGNDIPTYDNDDIKELAQVFTGLGPGDINDMITWTDEPYFGLGIYGADMTVPMVVYDDFHENDEKELINGLTIPAGQDGMTDIEMTVNHLFNHPNVGPFLATRLIQRFIKSNPSPSYVERVATIFNNNGQGVRGDLEAVVKAILLDDEARECAPLQSLENGRLREPMVTAIQFARSVEIDNPLNRYWHNGYDLIQQVKQFPLAAPSVFNFYTPDYSPVGGVSEAGLVAPEFKIHDSSTSIQGINKIYAWNIWDGPWYSWHGEYGDPDIGYLTDQFNGVVENPEALLNYLDILYTHGQLTDETRGYIKEAISPMAPDEWEVVRNAIYLLMISPDYKIQK